MAYEQVRQIINRMQSLPHAWKRSLRESFTQVYSDLATTTASVSALTTEVQLVGADAVVATVGGATTGLIPATAHFAEVTSSVNTKQVSLPAALAGKQIYIFCGTNGCELISAVAADKVNNVVVGATNEAALVAATLYSVVYDGVDNWVMTGLTNQGAVETPVVPNSL
jgi:hypothetical protein